MSQEQQLSTTDDEIDLRELLQTIWRGRVLITVCVIACICVASLHLRSAERKYTVTYTFQPVSDSNQGIRGNGLGGLASLAGITLPTSGSGDFQTFEALLQSEEVAEQLINKQEIIREVFDTEWNNQVKRFEQPEYSFKGQAVTAIKALLTGEGRQDYVQPNAARLSVWLYRAFSISTDVETGSLVLSSETSNPSFIIEIMTAVTTATDRIIKDRFLANGRQSIKFYESKIAAAQSRESREALAQLIVKEQQKLMLASNGRFFVAKPLTTPTVSLHPTSPKSSLTLALAFLLGGFLGATIVLIRKAIKND